VQQKSRVCEMCFEPFVPFVPKDIKMGEKVIINCRYDDNKLPKDGSTVKSQTMYIGIIHQKVDGVQYLYNESVMLTNFKGPITGHSRAF
jgi:hypothetical protein